MKCQVGFVGFFEGAVGRVTGPFFLPSTVSEMRVFPDMMSVILELCSN